MCDLTNGFTGEGSSGCIFAFVVFVDEGDDWRPSMRNVDSLHQGIVATSICSRFFDVRAEAFFMCLFDISLSVNLLGCLFLVI